LCNEERGNERQEELPWKFKNKKGFAPEVARTRLKSHGTKLSPPLPVVVVRADDVVVVVVPTAVNAIFV
jgi:hypothetical protein